MEPIQSTQSFFLDLPPSCIAFSQLTPEYFVVGTYFLHPKENTAQDGEEETNESSDEAPQRRSGSLILYRLVDDEITHIATYPTPDFSILDIKWSPHTTTNPENVLGVATSTGQLAFYRLTIPTQGPPTLTHLSTHPITKPDVLVLWLEFPKTTASTIACTLSSGEVLLVESPPSTTPWSIPTSSLTKTPCPSHSLEAWTTAFTTDPSTPSPEAYTLYTGGDDAHLQRISIPPLSPLPPTYPAPSAPPARTSPSLLWTDRKAHEAGVTAILPLASDWLITGSYDDRIRLLDAPRVGRRNVQAELDLGGGVWRIQDLGLSAEDDTLLLVSCMHAGARVVRLTQGGSEDGGEDEDGASNSGKAEGEGGAGAMLFGESSGEWKFEVLASFTEHESMCYGADAQPSHREFEARTLVGKPLRKAVVSVSFYDKRMCLWFVDV